MPAQVEIIDMLTELAKISAIGLLSPAVDMAASFAGGYPDPCIQRKRA